MKRFIALVMALLIILSVFSGCQSSDGKSDTTTTAETSKVEATTTAAAQAETKEITYVNLGGTGKDLLAQAATDFEAKTGVKVNIQDWAYADAYQKIITLTGAKNPPDAMYGFSSWIQQFMKSGDSAPLDEYITPEFKADFMQSAVDVCSVDGKLWALPYYMSIRTLLINKDAFAAAKVEAPKSYADLLAAAPKLTDAKNGKYATALIAGMPKNTLDVFLPFLWSFGADVLTPDQKKTAFNTPDGIAALQMYVDLSKYAVPDYGEADIYAMEKDFTSGAAAAIIHSAAPMKSLENEGKSSAFVEPLQPLEGKAGIRASLGVMDVNLVFKTGNEQAAADFLMFWQTKDRAAVVSENTGYIPNQNSWYERPAFKDPANLLVAPFAEAGKYAKFKPSVTCWEELQKVMTDAIAKAIMGELSATDAFKLAAEQGDALLAKQ